MIPKPTVMQKQKAKYEGRNYCGYPARKQLIDLITPQLRSCRTYFHQGTYGVVNHLSASGNLAVDLGEDYFDKGQRLRAANRLLGKNLSLNDEKYMNDYYSYALDRFSMDVKGYLETVYYDKFERPLISTDPESEECGESNDLELLYSKFTNKPYFKSSLHKVVTAEDIQDDNERSYSKNKKSSGYYDDLLASHESELDESSENDTLLENNEDDSDKENIQAKPDISSKKKCRVLLESTETSGKKSTRVEHTDKVDSLPIRSPRNAIELSREKNSISDGTFVEVEIPEEEIPALELDSTKVQEELQSADDEHYQSVFGFLMNRPGIQEIIDDEETSSSADSFDESVSVEGLSKETKATDSEPVKDLNDSGSESILEHKLEREANLENHFSSIPENDERYDRALTLLLLRHRVPPLQTSEITDSEDEEEESDTDEEKLLIKPRRTRSNKRKSRDLQKEAAWNSLKAKETELIKRQKEKEKKNRNKSIRSTDVESRGRQLSKKDKYVQATRAMFEAPSGGVGSNSRSALIDQWVEIQYSKCNLKATDDEDINN